MSEPQSPMHLDDRGQWQIREQKGLDRPELTDWIYNALKEIETEEDIRLSDRAFIADHLAPKLLALFPDIEEIRKQGEERIINHIEKNCKNYRDSTVGQLLDSMFWQTLGEK